jgi:hypothetical protein
MENEILIGRFGQWATRLFGIKGANPTPQLSPEVQVVVELNDPPPSTLVYQQINLCAGSAFTTAAPGLQSSVCLNNPANSGIIAHITDIWYSQGAVSQVTMGTQDGAALAGVLQAVRGFRDRRAKGTTPVCPLTYDSGAPGLPGANIYLANSASSTPYHVPGPVILSPGKRLVITQLTVNSVLVVTIWWRERPLDKAELQ